LQRNLSLTHSLDPPSATLRCSYVNSSARQSQGWLGRGAGICRCGAPHLGAAHRLIRSCRGTVPRRPIANLPNRARKTSAASRIPALGLTNRHPRKPACIGHWMPNRSVEWADTLRLWFERGCRSERSGGTTWAMRSVRRMCRRSSRSRDG